MIETQVPSKSPGSNLFCFFFSSVLSFIPTKIANEMIPLILSIVYIKPDFVPLPSPLLLRNTQMFESH